MHNVPFTSRQVLCSEAEFNEFYFGKCIPAQVHSKLAPMQIKHLCVIILSQTSIITYYIAVHSPRVLQNRSPPLINSGKTAGNALAQGILFLERFPTFKHAHPYTCMRFKDVF